MMVILAKAFISPLILVKQNITARLVGKYVVRGKFLDLNNKTGDYSLGGAKKFIGWATQLDEIGALDDFTKEGLEGAKKLVKYFDKNVKFNPGQNPDGTTGVYAQIADPTRKPQIYKGKEYPETVDLRVDARGFFAEDEAKAPSGDDIVL